MDDYLDSPMEDDVFPCKGCGEILEEGKAFELAGNRWHLNCFRCNTCGTLLDSDANLLLLGDGSLICNNCTYSCSACGNKIEDLAILTGDQAFCATCFRCRNCKRKIENLRYARTSQGIFCMNCHESLMARRRKKSKTAAQAKGGRDKESPMVEKSLPALPPSAIPPGAFSEDRVDPDSDTPTELSPRPSRPNYPRKESTASRGSPRPARSPERHQDPSMLPGLGLPPAPNYRSNRRSGMFGAPADLSGAAANNYAGQDQGTDPEGETDFHFIPVALDPSPVPSAASRSNTEPSDQRKANSNKDYFARQNTMPDIKGDSRGSAASTPHIAFQEKSQASPDDETPSRPNGRPDEFKLQDAPKSKKLSSNRSPIHASGHGDQESPLTSGRSPTKSNSPPGSVASSGLSVDTSDAHSRDEDKRQVSEAVASSRAGDAVNSKPVARKDGPAAAASRNVNGKSSKKDELVPPQRPQVEQHMSDTYMSPRAPPQPPGGSAIKETPKGAQNGAVSPTKTSPALPRWSSGGDFTMDEDMARILGTDEGSSSILRRVSNAVRHGRTGSAESPNMQQRGNHNRSMSETTRTAGSPRWPKTPTLTDPNGEAKDISSPISVQSATEDPAYLRRQLRNSEQRVAELEKRFNSEKDLLTLNEKLIDKRKTVSVLDTQTEIMIRQLEVLTEHVERAKQSNQPIDPRVLEDSAIKEFVRKLEDVQQSMTKNIAQLHAERDRVVEEKNQAAADRDRALLEFEQLSNKNAELAELNNDLTHQIQGRFRSQANGSNGKISGLGIYATNHAASSTSVHNIDASSIQTGQTMVGTDVDEPILEGPTVVQVRKGQAKKFNWKKGGKTVAQNITKVGRAVGAFQTNERDPRAGPQPGGLSTGDIGLPYNMTQANMEAPTMITTLPSGQQKGMNPNDARSFGFFGKKQQPGSIPSSKSTANIALPMAVLDASTTLFGADLVERADFERRLIPNVVIRCIQEVDIRGMDCEGIYRKSGGSSQVKMLQEGFDKNEDYDISDSSIDIASVTSVLKQYFRKLPNPLLTFEVYDRFLECIQLEDPEDRIVHLRQTVNYLPEAHRACLEFLMFHLTRVASREKENFMSPKNLAVVFAPSIMRDLSLEREMTDMAAKSVAVQFLIENSDKIFATE